MSADVMKPMTAVYLSLQCVSHRTRLHVHVTLTQSHALIAFAEGLVIDCSIGQISSFLQAGADQIVHFCVMDLVYRTNSII